MRFVAAVFMADPICLDGCRGRRESLGWLSGGVLRGTFLRWHGLAGDDFGLSITGMAWVIFALPLFVVVSVS